MEKQIWQSQFSAGLFFFLEEEWEAVGGHEAHRTYCFMVPGQRFHNETPCAACELHRVFVRNVAAW